MKAAKIISLMIVVFITTSVNLFSQTAEEWKKLGNIELDSANYEKAIEYYQMSVDVDSTYFDAYYNLAIVYYNTSEYDKAIDVLQKAISLRDTDADTYFFLGNIYLEKEDYDQAIEAVEKGIELNPESPDGYNYLGALYQEKGSFTYGLMYFKKAAQLGDVSAQQYFLENGMSWKDNFAKPDYEQIKQNVEDTESHLYYSKLWDRFQEGDSTMSIEEKRHLYYGYVFNSNYSPYTSTHDYKRANAILDKDTPTKKEWEELVSLYNKSLKSEPFNLRYLIYQRTAYNSLNKPEEAKRNLQKIYNIMDALDSTGDGLTKETAIHVIGVYSEYDYLFLNKMAAESQSLIDGIFDVLSLQANENGIDEMWFDVSQSLNYLNRLSK